MATVRLIDRRIRSLCVGFLLACAPVVCAAEFYALVPVQELTIVDGKLPSDLNKWTREPRAWLRQEVMQPYATLDQDGEAHVDASAWTMAVRVGQRVTVSGWLFLPQEDARAMTRMRFQLPANQLSADGRREFLTARVNHYEKLLHRDIPGAAWFRHQRKQTLQELGQSLPATEAGPRRFFGTLRLNDMENTFALVSGGRAVAENLQLDRELPTTQPADAPVPIDSIAGITVREFDWSSLNTPAEAKLDALASLIPDDQHAIFFRSFQALVDVVDHAEKHGTPILRAVDPRSEDAGTKDWYQRQLCLPLGELERLLGPHLIASAAITGGDPYFRTGTDVAVVFETSNVTALRSALDARLAISGRSRADAQPVAGDMFGIRYTGLRTPDREICSYVANLENGVVVSNSIVQLERIVCAAKGGLPSLVTSPEYRYFRNRYMLGNKLESAFLLITDKTIRRLCGPRWRIATSRRTRALAVMSELQSRHLDQLVAGKVAVQDVSAEYWLPDVDVYTVTPRGIQSKVYGTLHYLTPISELMIDFATREEAALYQRWRDGYQRNWSNYFDPIAASIRVRPDSLGVDLTVMPLIDNSQYQTLISVSKGASLGPDDGDPHQGSLLHWALALNTDSPRLKQLANMASGLAPQIQVNPLSWVGNAIAIYVDQDPLWEEMAKVEDIEAARRFLEDHLDRIPIALHIKVRDGLKLTLFLTGVRGFVEQAAPGMTVWETLQHEGQSYVQITPSVNAQSADAKLAKLAVYYAPSGESLVVSLKEDMIKRAIDRRLARAKAGSQLAEPRKIPPSLAPNMSFRVDGNFVRAMEAIFGDNHRQMMQVRSWGNIPILNEWKHRYPSQDPVGLHHSFWQRKLVCPGGGEYRWNDEWKTMESTVYGHPGQPRLGTGLPNVWRAIHHGEFGIAFEEHGLRGRAEVHGPTVRE